MNEAYHSAARERDTTSRRAPSALLALFCTCALLIMAATASAQSTLSDEPDYGAPAGDDYFVPKLQLGVLEDSEYGVLGFGVPFSTLFTEEFGEPSAPWGSLLAGQRISFDPKAKFGNARFILPSPSLDADAGFDVPFLEQGFAPGDGYQLKIGPLYARSNRVSFETLYSDNVHQVDENHKKEDGMIAISSMDFEILLQLTEGLQLNVDGALVWLPFENAIGFDGFGMRDGFRVHGNTQYDAGLRASGAYSFLAAGWDISIEATYERDQYKDDIYANYTRAIELWDDTRFDEEDRAGTYVFGGDAFGPTGSRYTTDGSESNTSGFDDYDSSDRWRASTRVTASRDIPMGQSVYMNMRLAREDNYTTEDGYFLVETDESMTLQFTSERENTRFKPFATYTLSRSYDNRAPDHEQHHWSHVFRIGVAGPVTENIYLYADFGYSLQEYYQDDVEDTEAELYRVGITHRINPNMGQTFEISREIDNDLEIADVVRYSYYQKIGKGLRMVFTFTESNSFTRNSRDVSNWTQEKELAFVYTVSPKTNLTLRGSQRDRRLLTTSSRVEEYEELEINATLDHQLTHSIDISLEYTHSEEERGANGSRITENLVTLMITKTFRAAPGYKRPGF